MSEDELTQDEMIELQKFLSGAGIQSSDEKGNLHNFLNKVIQTKDTTKLGYLNDEELGKPKHPIRTYKELELFCNDIADMEYFANYFKAMSEITTATSLSKEAKLLNLAVIQRREFGDITKKKQKPRGFFAKKEKETQEV